MIIINLLLAKKLIKLGSTLLFLLTIDAKGFFQVNNPTSYTAIIFKNQYSNTFLIVFGTY